MTRPLVKRRLFNCINTLIILSLVQSTQVRPHRLCLTVEPGHIVNVTRIWKSENGGDDNLIWNRATNGSIPKCHSETDFICQEKDNILIFTRDQTERQVYSCEGNTSKKCEKCLEEDSISDDSALSPTTTHAVSTSMKTSIGDHEAHRKGKETV